MQLGCVAVRVNNIGLSGQRPAAPMCERVISSRYGATVERRCHGFCQDAWRDLASSPSLLFSLSSSVPRQWMDVFAGATCTPVVETWCKCGNGAGHVLLSAKAARADAACADAASRVH